MVLRDDGIMSQNTSVSPQGTPYLSVATVALQLVVFPIVGDSQLMALQISWCCNGASSFAIPAAVLQLIALLSLANRLLLVQLQKLPASVSSCLVYQGH